MIRRITILSLSFVLSACSTTNVGLSYSASPSLAKNTESSVVVAVGTFLDRREEPGRRLGAILGGYGNPLKTLESDRPIPDLVQLAISDGLKTRGFRVSDEGKAKITGTVTKLDCSQYVRREANVEIEIEVLDQSNQKKFGSTYSASNLEGSLITLDAGIFASVDDLRAVLEKTLKQAIDKALDDHALRAALE